MHNWLFISINVVMLCVCFAMCFAGRNGFKSFSLWNLQRVVIWDRRSLSCALPLYFCCASAEVSYFWWLLEALRLNLVWMTVKLGVEECVFKSCVGKSICQKNSRWWWLSSVTNIKSTVSILIEFWRHFGMGLLLKSDFKNMPFTIEKWGRRLKNGECESSGKTEQDITRTVLKVNLMFICSYVIGISFTSHSRILLSLT